MKDSYQLITKNGKVRLIKNNQTWNLRKQIQGEQRFISLRTANQNQAESTARQFLELCNNFTFEEALERLFPDLIKKEEKPDEMTIESYLKLYDQFCKESEKAPSAKTQRSIKNYLNLIKRKTDSVTLKDLTKINQSKMTELYPNPKARNSVLAQVRSLFKLPMLRWLEREKKIIIDNPLKFLEMSKTRIEPYVPFKPKVRKEIEESIEKQTNTIQLMFLLAYRLGLRRNETDKIRYHSLTLTDNGAILKIQKEDNFNPKSRQSRILKMDKKLYNQILSLRGKTESDYLVPSDALQRKNKSGGIGRVESHGNYRLNNYFEQIIAYLKPFETDYHGLRKEFGSKVAQLHGLMAACETLGHSSYAVTLAYYSSLIDSPTLS